MWIIRHGVPILAIVGFGHAAYQVFTEKLHADKMGVYRNVLIMFSIGETLMAASWAIVFLGLWTDGAQWPQSLAVFATGMYCCNYLVSLAMFRNMDDRWFKYWGSGAMALLVLYCIWL